MLGALQREVNEMRIAGLAVERNRKKWASIRGDGRFTCHQFGLTMLCNLRLRVWSARKFLIIAYLRRSGREGWVWFTVPKTSASNARLL
jgi:hypothetical protein